MQAYYFERLGVGLDGLTLGERVEPQPGSNEVLVRIHARSVNYRDGRILAGVLSGAGPLRHSRPLGRRR